MRSQRARRLTGCTALALSAGMVLASPASADSPAPRPAAEKPSTAPVAPSNRFVPEADGAPAGAAGGP
ncbi:hypothetical protein ACFWWN_22490, partial [Streptomyces sp. NPDC059082]